MKRKQDASFGAGLRQSGCRGLSLLFSIITLTLLVRPVETHGVIVVGSDDPVYNLAPATGAYANSGYSYITSSGLMGTAISASHIITAEHIGGTAGQSITYQGQSYTLLEKYDSPDSDLRIWKIDGHFDSWATLYSGDDEIGKELVVYGKGTQRGDEVTDGEGEVTGWQWGAKDGQLRWGVNEVNNVVNVGGSLGQLLQVRFDDNGDPMEAHLSSGDSGGPVFIDDGGTWKLAGVNYGVDGPSQTAAFGSNFYASRISGGDNYVWINTVITAVPEPEEWAMLSGVGLVVFAVIRRRLASKADAF